MALRAPSQCRQTLARRRTSTTPTIWITDRMLFEAFQRYSLSSIRSTGADARCVHFNAGPLEHRRRAGKRRMTAVLPVSRLELPTWLLPVAQDNSAPTWFPPSNPIERHKNPGLLNRVVSWLVTWLEDYPPDKPFITPPADATDEMTSMLDQDGFDPIGHMSKMRNELLSTAEDFKARRAVLNKYFDALVPSITKLVQTQAYSGLRTKADRDLLQCLLDPYAGQEDLMQDADLDVAARVLGYWQARVVRSFMAIARTDSRMMQSPGIWIELSVLLCNSQLFHMQRQTWTAQAEKYWTTGSISSESFYSWCFIIKQLKRAINKVPAQHSGHLFQSMDRFLTSLSPETTCVFDARLSWAAVLLWRPTYRERIAFDDVYNRHLRDGPEDVLDERNWYLTLTESCLSHSLSREDFNTIYAYRHSASRWPALFAVLSNQGERSSRLLRKAYSLLQRLNHIDEAAAAVRAETKPALGRCVEGLAIAAGDYRAALRLHKYKTVGVSRFTPKDAPWSYNIWAPYVSSMIKDPRVSLKDITALIGTIGDRNIVNGVPIPQEERDGRARLLEEMSHTLAYCAPKVRPWRAWKELSLWNQLYRKFAKQYSAKISQVMLDLVISRLQRGEVVSCRRLHLMVDIVRTEAGEEKAQAFSRLIFGWRDRNRYLGTEQQKFPLRFRPDYSRAEMAMLIGNASASEEDAHARVAQLLTDASTVSRDQTDKNMAGADGPEVDAFAEKLRAARL